MNQNGTSHLTIEEKIDWLLKRNEEYSDKFLQDEYSRIIYRILYKIFICAFKCMDGRVHIPALTNVPLGIIKPFRRLGGIFNIGWPFIGEKFTEWLWSVVNSGTTAISLITYHFSKGNNDVQGCAGFNCNLEEANDFTLTLKAQIERSFGKENTPIYPIIVGIETDEDGLIFHNGENQISIYDIIDQPESEIKESFKNLYHNMPDEVLFNIMPLVFGNIKHVKETRKLSRPIIETGHREWMIALGSGFDWLHAPNTALIIGPWSPRYDIDIRKAFNIIRHNMQEKKISSDGFVLLVSSEYKGFDKNIKVEKVNFLKTYALDILNEKEFADLKDKVRVLPALVDEHNKKMENIQSKIDKIPYTKWY